MTQTDPSSRPSAEETLQQWRTIRARIYSLHRYWRLRDSKEPPLFGPALDFFYVLVSILRVFRLVGRMLRPNFTRVVLALGLLSYEHSSSFRAMKPQPVTTQAQDDISHSVTSSGRSAQLSSYEIVWRDRQPFLESKGYMLRPRLRPGWTPSWLATGKSRIFSEDFARLPVSP